MNKNFSLKILAAGLCLSMSVSPAAASAADTVYDIGGAMHSIKTYDSAAEVIATVKYYIDQGLYLEAIRYGETHQYGLSGSNLSDLEYYIQQAKSKYEKYLEDLNKSKQAAIEKAKYDMESYISRGMYLEAIKCGENALVQYSTASYEAQTQIRNLISTAKTKYNDYLQKTQKEKEKAAISGILSTMRGYIDKGLYLEAKKYGAEQKSKLNLTSSQLAEINALISTAEKKYAEYVASVGVEYYHSSWGMKFHVTKDMEPEFYYDDYMNLYSTSSYSKYIDMYSLKIDNKYIKSAKQYIDEYVASVKGLSTGDFGSKTAVLSANNTTVGNMSAYQVTYRTTTYTNRYWTKGTYQMVKLIGFKYGSWIYIIHAEENKYDWSDDFWNKIEVVRKGISFE